MQAALAHDTVSPPLKPYTENRSKYHPITGTGCTGLPDDSAELTDEIVPSAETTLAPPETLIPGK